MNQIISDEKVNHIQICLQHIQNCEMKSPAVVSKETCGTCFFTPLMRTATSSTERLWIWYIKQRNIRSYLNNIISYPIRFISYPKLWSTETVDAQLSFSSKFWILVHCRIVLEDLDHGEQMCHSYNLIFLPKYPSVYIFTHQQQH